MKLTIHTYNEPLDSWDDIVYNDVDYQEWYDNEMTFYDSKNDKEYVLDMKNMILEVYDVEDNRNTLNETINVGWFDVE